MDSKEERRAAPEAATASKRERRGQAKLQPLWETEARSGPKMEARAHVLEAAAAAFMERGYAATTLDDVAAILGTTKGQIYHYYRSKMDLHFDVVVGAFFMLADKTNPIFEMTELAVPERLRRVAATHALVILTNFPFQRVALEAMQHQLIDQLTPRQERAMSRILQFRDDYERSVTALIAEGVASGEFETGSVEFAAKAVLGSLNWLTVWFDPKRPVTAEQRGRIADRIAAFVVLGLLAVPA
jgi:AcrR family transcriptional regulator